MFHRRHDRPCGDAVSGRSGSPWADQLRDAERHNGCADGVPLFIEELTKAVIESNVLVVDAGRYVLKGPLPTLQIPPTLHDSLMSRLDRLQPVREVAQIGAAIGREFPYLMLEAVARIPIKRLQNALEQLLNAGLIYGRGEIPQSVYTFKHAMVRDAAYDSLLRSRRRSLHARIAEVIEQQFSEVTEQQPDFIAHHCIEANLTTKAVSYLCAAGRRSASRSETIEAMRQLQKGLTLIPYLPDTAERWRLELELQSLLGAVWFATRGPAAPETGQAYDRAKQLCEQLGDDKALVPVLSGQSTYHLCRCELAPMKRIGEDLLRLGTEKDHAVSRMVGHSTLGFCLTYLSEFANAIDQFERALALYDPVAHPALASVAALDIRTTSLANMSWCLVFRGYPDQAVSRSNQALDWSRKLRNSNVLAFALLHASICLQLQRADEAALEVLKEQIPLCTEQRFPVYLALAHLMQGYLLATRGETEQGLALARAGFQNLTATGFLLGRPYYLGFLVQSCARAGEVDEAFELIDQALAETEQTSERWVEAELLRLKGEWLTTHQRGGYARPEVYLEQAISVAQAQGARLLELRSIVSLCRCLGKHGRSAELRKLLMPICNSFQEGFGTPDLQDARLIISSLT